MSEPTNAERVAKLNEIMAKSDLPPTVTREVPRPLTVGELAEFNAWWRERTAEVAPNE